MSSAFGAGQVNYHTRNFAGFLYLFIFIIVVCIGISVKNIPQHGFTYPCYLYNKALPYEVGEI